jgi:predicted RNA-binding protein YlqC (UPF0109 family)
MLKDLVEYIVRKLVDSPDSVNVTEVVGEESTVIELRVASDDLGKVIGKEGRTARSLRTLVHAAATRDGRKAVLEIME